MKRTDTHRPSAIVPTEYEYVGIECLKIEGIGDCYVQLQARERIRQHMARTGGTYSRHAHGGNCHVCGSVNAVYTHLFYHVKTNSYVRTGTDCTDKLDYAGTAEDMDAFKTATKAARELHAGKRKAEALLNEFNLSAAWTIYVDSSEGKEESTVRDIVVKLVKYGQFASDKQREFLRYQLSRIANRAANKEKYDAEKAKAAACPTGRVTVKGTLLSWRTENSDFGLVTKMFVKADEGYTVWCSMPRGLETPERGMHIAFTATLTPATNDPKHGFGKRPVIA